MGEVFVGIPSLLKKQAGGAGNLLSHNTIVAEREAITVALRKNRCLSKSIEMKTKHSHKFYLLLTQHLLHNFMPFRSL